MRNRRFNGFVGSPGSGKSTYCANAIKQYNGGNAIVLKHLVNVDDKAFNFLPQKSPGNWRQGASPGTPVKCKFAVTDEDYKDTLHWVKKDYRNGLLLIDDATIFERDRMSKEMQHLVSMRRHYGLDIWLVYHGFTAFPIDQFIFINYLMIFNTNDNIRYKSNKIPQYDAILEATEQARINFKSTSPAIKYRPEIVLLSH